MKYALKWSWLWIMIAVFMPVFITKALYLENVSRNRRSFFKNKKCETFAHRVVRYFSKNLVCQAIKEKRELRRKQENCWEQKVFVWLYELWNSLWKFYDFCFKTANGPKWQLILWVCIFFVTKTEMIEDFRIFHSIFCMWNEVIYVVYLEERYVLFLTHFFRI